MDDFEGRTAFITGGGSGVGLGQAKVMAEAGAKVILVDIRRDMLDKALPWFHARGHQAHAIVLDVTDRHAYARAADEAEATFGPVTLLFNTAGVSMFGPLEKGSYADFDWHMGVNFDGVVNGMMTFVPRMIAQDQGGHIVNTASISGLRASDSAGIYSASKFAVVGLTQAYAQALGKYGIGVSLLCPANVNTNIADAADTRPAHLRDSGWTFDDNDRHALASLYSQGMDPVVLGRHVKQAMIDKQFYIIPYPEMKEVLATHFQEILDSIPGRETDPDGIEQRARAMDAFRRGNAAAPVPAGLGRTSGNT